jgi:large subunit ribosomal protein L5
MSDNIMKQIKIGKVVVNISVGQSGQPLANAMQILTDITGQAPSQRSAKMTIRQWGIRKGEPMACAVTLRGERADAFLQKAFTAVRHKINPRSFDNNGNFAFGIREHIDIPGVRYDPATGIIGMDVMATVERPGFRVRRKKRGQSKVGSSHRVTPDESRAFISEKFGVTMGLE